MKNSPVKVRKFSDGSLLKYSQDGKYARAIIQQKVVTIRNNFVNEQKRNAFISGSKEFMEQNFKEGQILPGAILEHRSLTPYFEGQQPIMTKEGEPVLYNGQLQYRKYEYVAELDPNDPKTHMVIWDVPKDVEVE